METTEIDSRLNKYDEMSLEELEQSIIALWSGDSRKNRNELGDCLFERKHRINNDHPITARELT